jgi:hypothetical protein
MSWFFYVNGGKDVVYLAFSFARHKYHVYQHDLYGDRKFQPIMRKIFKLVMYKVKQQCDRASQSPISELEWRFLEHQVMTALGVVYSQFWVKNPKDVKE